MTAAAHRVEKIISNTALITGASLVQKALSFLYFWFVSRNYAPTELGGYLWVLSMTGLFVTGIDLGLTPILTREAAKEGADGKKFTEAVLWLKLPLAAATTILLWGAVLSTRRDPLTIAMLAVATGVMVFDGFTMALFAALRARQRLAYEATVLIVFQAVVFLLGAVVTFTTRSLPHLLGALLVGSVLNLVIMEIAARRVYGSLLLPRRHPEFIRRALRLIPAFAGSAVVTKIYAVGDVILLGYLAGDIAVGLYSIPAKVATALQTLIPAAFATAIYPSMANFASVDRAKLRLVFERSLLYVFLLAMPVALGLILLAPPILNTIWPAYRAATGAFMIMMAGIPFIFLTYSTGSLLNAADRETRATGNRMANTAFNLALNLALIPRFGVAGAAAAYAISNVSLFILDSAPSWREARPNGKFLMHRGIGTLMAAALMAAIILLLRERLVFWYTIPISGAAYIAGLIIFRVLKAGEFRAIRDLFRRRAPHSAEAYEIIPPANS